MRVTAMSVLDESQPMTSCLRARSWVRMLPPILPEPTSPMCIFFPSRRSGRSGRGRSAPEAPSRPGGRAQAEHVVGVVRATVELALPAQHSWLARLGEGQSRAGVRDHAEAVEQEVWVERDLDLLTLQRGSTASLACASSPWLASITTWPSVKAAGLVLRLGPRAPPA